MAVELVKKPITLEGMTRKESVQVIKERDIIVNGQEKPHKFG